MTESNEVPPEIAAIDEQIENLEIAIKALGEEDSPACVFFRDRIRELKKRRAKLERGR